MMKSVLALCVLASAVSGCSSAEKRAQWKADIAAAKARDNPPAPSSERFDARCKSWVGRTTEDLILSWGIPAKEYQVDKQTKLIEFEVGGGSVMVPIAGTLANVNRSCKVTFMAKDGVVTKYGWEGNVCRE